MIKTIVIAAPLAGKCAHWYAQLVENDYLTYDQIHAIVYNLPVTQGSYRLLREYLETKEDDMLTIERVLDDFRTFMSPQEAKRLEEHLKDLRGDTGEDDEEDWDGLHCG